MLSEVNDIWPRLALYMPGPCSSAGRAHPSSAATLMLTPQVSPWWALAAETPQLPSYCTAQIRGSFMSAMKEKNHKTNQRRTAVEITVSVDLQKSAKIMQTLKDSTYVPKCTELWQSVPIHQLRKRAFTFDCIYIAWGCCPLFSTSYCLRTGNDELQRSCRSFLCTLTSCSPPAPLRL